MNALAAIGEHDAAIRSACERAGIEPVEARLVPGPAADAVPSYVVAARTHAGRLNLAVIHPDFDGTLHGFELVDGDVSTALARRADEEADAIRTAVRVADLRPCPRHPRWSVLRCGACERLIEAMQGGDQ